MNKPEINQKVQQKVCLRAYGDEIERLRKDLQAARDKNGVFLDEDNYQCVTKIVCFHKYILIFFLGQ